MEVLVEKIKQADEPAELFYYQLMRDFGIRWMETIDQTIRAMPDEEHAREAWVAMIFATQKTMAAIGAALFSGRVDPQLYDEVALTFSKDLGVDLRRLLVTRREMDSGDRPPEASIH